MSHRNASLGRSPQPVRCRVYPRHCCKFQVIGLLADLDHQVGADVARADDGDFPACHGLLFEDGVKRFKTLDFDDPVNLLKHFKGNRHAGMLVTLGLALGMVAV